MGPAGETSGAGVGVPPAAEASKEPAEEASEADEPLAPKKRHVLRWTGSNELVQPGKTTQRQQAQTWPMRQTRQAAAEALEVDAAQRGPQH